MCVGYDLLSTTFVLGSCSTAATDPNLLWSNVKSMVDKADAALPTAAEYDELHGVCVVYVL